MTKKPWSIWLARVYFEDDPGVSKVRPVIILDEQKCLCLALKVTSKLHHPDSYVLKDWAFSNLSKQSAVRIDAVIRLIDSDFCGYVGELSENDRRELENEVNIRLFYGKLRTGRF